MMQKTITFLLLVLASYTAGAQLYFTRSGKISFYSHAPMEDIEAHNSSATSVLNISNGRIEFAVLIKGFQFKKSLMQEHFNENFMESSKYPKGVFKGYIRNLDEIDFKKNGTYTARVSGKLTIRGITKRVSAKGKFTVKNGRISATSNFRVAIDDYDIKVPRVVIDNIAKVVRVDVKMEYRVLKR